MQRDLLRVRRHGLLDRGLVVQWVQDVQEWVDAFELLVNHIDQLVQLALPVGLDWPDFQPEVDGITVWRDSEAAHFGSLADRLGEGFAHYPGVRANIDDHALFLSRRHRHHSIAAEPTTAGVPRRTSTRPM